MELGSPFEKGIIEGIILEEESSLLGAFSSMLKAGIFVTIDHSRILRRAKYTRIIKSRITQLRVP